MRILSVQIQNSANFLHSPPVASKLKSLWFRYLEVLARNELLTYIFLATVFVTEI